MRSFLSYRGWLLACLLAVFPLRLVAQETPLVVGILPTLSPRVLLSNYQPIRSYLEKTLHRPVEMVTAKDFSTFSKSTARGDYDIVVTAAHLARLAEVESGYLPLVTYKAPNRAMLLTTSKAPLHNIQDLRGHTVATLDRSALITSQTLIWLREQGLQEPEDFKLIETSSHNSAAYSVLSGESTLAITSPGGWRMMPANIKDRLKLLTSLPPLPSMMWLAHRRLIKEAPNLRSVLLDFSPDLPEGKQFFDASGYQGMREITPQEMKSLDPFIPYLKQHLGQ